MIHVRLLMLVALVAGETAPARAQQPPQPLRDRASADLHVAVTVVRSCTIATRESPSRDVAPLDRVSVSCIRGAAPPKTAPAPGTSSATSVQLVVINF